jgi:diguanylate cyclase (GGDEF)-like protein
MVRAAVQDLGMPHATSVYQSVTVSVGDACTTPSDAQAPIDLIEAADAALYAAKHRGRNGGGGAWAGKGGGCGEHGDCELSPAPLC